MRLFSVNSSLCTPTLKSCTLTKQADVDLLERVNTAELIEFMVNLIKYQGFVIVSSEVPHYVVHWKEVTKTQIIMKEELSA